MHKKRNRPTGFFVAPFVYIAAALSLALIVLVWGLYYYPEVTIVSALIIAVIARQTLKKDHLTFFDESYSPEVHEDDPDQEMRLEQNVSEKSAKDKSTF